MTIRVGGIASNLDTESIIETLLQVRQTPITELENKVYDEETKLTAYTELQTMINDLQSAAVQLSNYTTWAQRSATSDDDTIATASASMGAQTGDYTFLVSTLAKAHRIGSDSQTSASDALGLEGDFTVEGETITVTASDSLQTIRDSINEAALNMSSATKVKAYIVDKSLVIERANTGSTDINISDGTNNILQSGTGGLGIFTGTVSSPTATLKNELQEAAGFTGKINGIDISSDSNTISSAVEGVTFVAKDVGTASITVGNDTASIKSIIEDFLTKYNDVLDTIKSEGAVSLSSSGEVEATGTLQGDPMLAGIESNLLKIMTYVQSNPNIVSADYSNLYKIGIWTTDDSGEFSIVDEDALDAALENHFDDVKNLFRYSSSGTNYGIAKQMDEYLTNISDPVDGSLTLKVNDLQEDINDSNDRIDEMYNDLTDYETELWEHFANMEDMVSTIKNSLNYLLSSLGS